MEKKKIIIGSFLIIGFVALLGTSFALWQLTLTSENKNVLSTACFKISLKEENPITLAKAFPINDQEGLELIPFTFTIENICDTYAHYQINLEILKNTTLNNLDSLKLSFGRIGDTRDPIFLTEKELVPPTLKNENKELISKEAYKLETGYLDISGKRSYQLNLWLDENTPPKEEIMEKILNCKISVIAIYIEDFDHELPTAVVKVERKNNKIKIDASESKDNVGIIKYYYSIDKENWISTENNTYEFEESVLEYGLASQMITTIEENQISSIYVKVEDEYGNMSEIVEKNTQELAYDNTTDNNLRYIGATPRNYVMFNDELWRIIGVMNNVNDGATAYESRLKIMRDENIGSCAWDSSPNTVNSGYGINEWAQADLNRVLNSGAYWNRTQGTCYRGQNNASVNVNFQTTGLKSSSKDFIKNTKWHTGTSNVSMHRAIKSSKYYEFERSKNTGKICSSGTHCNESVTRNAYWVGKVGLMYPSDYGYAVGGIEPLNRESCLEKNLDAWRTDCSGNNWIYKPYNQWTITPMSYVTATTYTYILSQGGVSYGTVDNHYGISYARPVVYLKPEVKITNGNGTKEVPYNLSLGQ